MIFSFFVAVMVTPWLMLKVAGRADMAAHGHGDAHGHPGGALGRAYAAVARPILASKARSWLFIAVVVVLTFGSLGLFYTQHVTVKLLPFDNKSELSVTIDLPEGSPVEATDAVAQAVAGAVLDLPEVRSVQTHAGTAAQGRARPDKPPDRAGDPPEDPRPAGARRHGAEDGGAAAGPAGDGDAPGRNLRAGPGDAPRRRGQGGGGVPRGAVHR
jgi:multidrug efflux pump subunit AcrB